MNPTNTFLSTIALLSRGNFGDIICLILRGTLKGSSLLSAYQHAHNDHQQILVLIFTVSNKMELLAVC